MKAASFEGDGSLLENVPAGADGAAATIGDPTITTGLAGTDASVTNSGTSSAAVFDFVIPRGDAGTNGTNGTNGANGEDGEDGAAATIAVGTTTPGPVGTTTASVINSGTSSAAVFDFVIPRGEQGTPGTNGTNYFTLSGSDIYRLAGNVGIGVLDADRKLHVETSTGTSENLIRIGSYMNDGSSRSVSGIEFMTNPQFYNDDNGQRVPACIKSGFYSDGTLVANWSDAYVTLQTTASNGGALVDNLTCRGGNVGIGVTDPDEKLEINGSLKFTDQYNNIKFTGQGGGITWAGGNSQVIDDGHLRICSDDLIAFQIGSNSSGDKGTERMVIDGNGRVKITESGGGTAASTTTGTLTLQHENNYGSSSIVFPSKVNNGSDYAWIEYDEDGGEGGEAAKLKIGITNDADDDIMLQTSGGVGITSGTPTSVYHPFGKLEIQDPPSNSGVSNYRCYQSWKYGAGMWAIAVDNRTDTNHNLYWYGTNNTSGNLQKILGFENDTANRGTAGIFAFTGQHRNIVTINPTSIESCIGLIVSANNNENIKVQGGVERGLNAIEINETLPLLSITNTAKDKSVFGVISGSEDPDSRVNKVGRVSNYYDKESGDDRVIINSLGEGALWITNANGPLESGDYITSSHIPGYGMKQDSDFLANYTVAKITMDCDFQATPRVKYTIKKELKTLIGYKSEHCLITETEYENIERDYEKAKYTRQERDENVNILDEHGQLQWEDSGETEAPYKVRYLLPDGTQISEEEYTTKALANEEVYIAAFAGCTYHCG